MKGRKKKRPDDEPWDRITQACPGAKTRFDPIIIPELLAWLELRRQRYAAAVDACESIPERDRTASLNGTIRHNRTAEGICTELMEGLHEHWSRHKWLGIVAEIDQAMKQSEPPAVPAGGA